MVDISIIVTAYNYERYIRECIDSCINQQTNSSFEVIVVDDGSTDATFKAASEYNSSLLRVFTIENGGIEVASNFGIRQAQGEHIVRVDADDKLHSRYIEVMRKEMKSEVDFLYPNYFVFNAQSKVTEQVSLPEFDVSEIRERGDFLATGTLYRKVALESVGYYSEENKNCGLENYELILKLLAAGSKGRRVSDPLFYYRRHDLNISELKRDKIIEYGRNLFQKLDLGQYRTNHYHPYKLTIENETCTDHKRSP